MSRACLPVCVVFLALLLGCGFSKPSAPTVSNGGPTTTRPSATTLPNKPTIIAKPTTFVGVEIGKVVDTYRTNEAAGDAQYLGKGCEFGLTPNGLEKTAEGKYALWWSSFGNDAERCKNVWCVLRADQVEVAGKLKLPKAVIRIRGVCAGVIGTQQTPIGQYPIIQFRDCVIVD